MTIKNYLESENRIEKLELEKFEIEEALHIKILLRKEDLFLKHSLLPLIPMILFLFMINDLSQAEFFLSDVLFSKTDTPELIRQVSETGFKIGILSMFLSVASFSYQHYKEMLINITHPCKYFNDYEIAPILCFFFILIISLFMFFASVLGRDEAINMPNISILFTPSIISIIAISLGSTIYSLWTKKKLKKEVENVGDYNNSDLSKIKDSLVLERKHNKKIKEEIVLNPILMKEVIERDSKELEKLIIHMENKSKDVFKKERDDRISKAYEILYGKEIKATVIMND